MKHKTPSAISVADFMIRYSNAKGMNMDKVRLNKLLFFVQWSSRKKYGIDAFDEKILATGYGSIVKSVNSYYSLANLFPIPSEFQNPFLPEWEKTHVPFRTKLICMNIINKSKNHSVGDLIRIILDTETHKNVMKDSYGISKSKCAIIRDAHWVY